MERDRECETAEILPVKRESIYRRILQGKITTRLYPRVSPWILVLPKQALKDTAKLNDNVVGTQEENFIDSKNGAH